MVLQGMGVQEGVKPGVEGTARGGGEGFRRSQNMGLRKGAVRQAGDILRRCIRNLEKPGRAKNFEWAGHIDKGNV